MTGMLSTDRINRYYKLADSMATFKVEGFGRLITSSLISWLRIRQSVDCI